MGWALPSNTALTFDGYCLGGGGGTVIASFITKCSRTLFWVTLDMAVQVDTRASGILDDDLVLYTS